MEVALLDRSYPQTVMKAAKTTIMMVPMYLAIFILPTSKNKTSVGMKSARTDKGRGDFAYLMRSINHPITSSYT